MKGDAMNQDPAYQKWREIAWRRPLSAKEQAEWRAWLAAHPEAQADVEAELLLSTTLAKLPDAPMPSNFTARVLMAVEKEEAQAKPTTASKTSWWVRVLLPRLAVATVIVVIVVSGTLAYRQHLKTQQGELAAVASDLVTAQPLSDPAVLEDFEVIASLNPMADEKLLALSDDLLALGQ
jgi:anti-sigma factor RsiW